MATRERQMQNPALPPMPVAHPPQTQLQVDAQPSLFLWGLMDQQILVQVFTVLLTLAVVALSRSISSWWNSGKPTAQTPVTTVEGKKPSEGAATKSDPTPDSGAAAPADVGKDKKDAKKDDAPKTQQDGGGDSSGPATTTPTTSADGGGATADKKQATTGPSDAKPKAGADAAPSPVTPQSLLLEVQAVHKSVKAMADGNLVAAGTKVSNEVEAVRKDITTVMKYLTASDKDVKDLTNKVCTLMTNLDIHAKSSESYLKEILKSLATIGAAKTFHADTQVLIAAKHDNIADGVKACINKVTNTDFETHQSLTRTLNDLSKQTYDLGQELLAALHHVQGEQGTLKDNLWQIANVLSDTVEQVKVIRGYCERPVPVNVQGGPQANMPPPPTYEPSIHAARQQLHLQSAIPVARGGGGPVPQVNIDMGDGRSINIPVHR